MSSSHHSHIRGTNFQAATNGRAQVDGTVDAGLRSYMLSVYNYMGLAVAFTGAIAMLVGMNPELSAFVTSMFWGFFLAVLGAGFVAPHIISSGSAAAAQLFFWAYAALWGMLLGPVLSAYAATDPMMILRAFLLSAVAFSGAGLVGYTTKKDLRPIGSFLAMATIGLLFALLLNVFFGSGAFDLLLSSIVVIVFAGLTAVETQMVKTFYLEKDGADTQNRKAIFGAYMLYGSFITLFIHILNILGILGSD